MKPSLKAMAKEAKTKKAAAPKKTATKAPPLSNLSTEFVQESDMEEDEKSDQASSSDDEESLTENPAVAISKANGNDAMPSVDSTSSSGSESESESGSAEDSESEDNDDEARSKTAKKATNASSASAHPQPSKASAIKTVSFKDMAPYKPPAGFEIASLDEPSNASQLFKKSNLEGKQLWYITAPAAVPISSIRETSLANIKQGNAVLAHNENDYGFIQDSSEDITYTKVMIPNGAEDSYLAGTKSVDRILHLQQIVQLPSIYEANLREAPRSTTARPTIPAKKPVRQQPAGLKMRFRPIGFGNGATGTIGSSSSSTDGTSTESVSDEEMEDAPPHLHHPVLVEPESASDNSNDESSSSSDAEMVDAPTLHSKSLVKTKPEKSATKESSKVDNHSLKRKHSEKGDMQTKNSSSSQPIQLITTDN